MVDPPSVPTSDPLPLRQGGDAGVDVRRNANAGARGARPAAANPARRPQPAAAAWRERELYSTRRPVAGAQRRRAEGPSSGGSSRRGGCAATGRASRTSLTLTSRRPAGSLDSDTGKRGRGLRQVDYGRHQEWRLIKKPSPRSVTR